MDIHDVTNKLDLLLLNKLNLKIKYNKVASNSL